MGGVTGSPLLTRAATPPRLPWLDRHTRLPRAGRLAGLHWMARLTRLIGMARASGMAIPEVLYALKVAAC